MPGEIPTTRPTDCSRGHPCEATSDAHSATCPPCAAGEGRAGVGALPISVGTLPISGGAAPTPQATVHPEFPGLRIIEEISPGVGGMGIVYKAQELSLDRVVAVKTMKARLESPEGLAFFEREAKAAARLDHPNILRIFRFSPDHVPPFYVMEYLDGRHLDEACRGRDFAYMAQLVEKVARVLAYAHARGVVHRDIKPANILVDAGGEPHVADFGVAGQFDPASQAPATLVGTPAFIAPEVYAGTGQVGPEIDIYALGVTLYELLTGRSPFPGRNPQEIREAVLRGCAALPQEINPAIPEPLQRICLQAMEKDSAARYESAQQMAEDLLRFREGREVSARPARYQQELRGRLQNHLTEIHLWHEQSLIDIRDMDRLSRPYEVLMQSASPWRQLSSRFPWESVLLRLGGWLVLLSSMLWPAFYWGTLSRTERVLAVGMPTAAMNLAGWLLRSRGSWVNSLIYLSTGALLLPLLVSVVLTEYRIFPHPQSEMRELFGAATDLSSTAAMSAPASDYAPTNLQLTLSAAAFCAYCAMLLGVTRVRLLAFWLAIGIYLAYTGILLLAGLKEWLTNQHVARALVCYLPAAMAFWSVATVLNQRPRTRDWAAVCFAFFIVPCVAIVSLLARYGAVEWLDTQPQWDSESINLWLMADGMIYFAGGLWCTTARASHVRFWGAMLMLLVPLHLLAPTQLLFDKAGRELIMLGAAPLNGYEAASLLLAILLIILGSRLRQQALVLPALIGLAVFVVRATERHFQEYCSWPLGVAIAGGVMMAAAIASLLWRARRHNEPVI